MRNATSDLVNEDFASIISNKTRHYTMGCQSSAQQKSHDTRNREDSKGTLQVLFLCTIKCVVFIVDISNSYSTRLWLRGNFSGKTFSNNLQVLRHVQAK